MASADNEFASMICDMLMALGEVRMRRMFGALGLYCDGLIFAIIDDEVLYLKGDEQTADAYADKGMEQFFYQSRGRRVGLPYFEVPGDWLDDGDMLLEFSRMAVGAALRHQNRPAKSPKRRKPAKTPQIA